MTTGQVRAGSAWLAMREPADAAARSSALVEILQPHLPAGGLVIHDLGCGTGSMARWLSRLLIGPQEWVMLDRDAELLVHARAHPPTQAADGGAVTAETRVADITRLDPGELAGVSLVTASALLDMFTAEELERFVDVCVSAASPVLITLSVVGRVELSPPDPFDAQVTEAFNAHQRRRTADGRLLGPDAAEAAVAAFKERGLEVLVRPSPWRLGPGRSALTAEWLTGWVEAACEQTPALTEEARPYVRRRLAEANAGSLFVTVHHQDLLALARD